MRSLPSAEKSSLPAKLNVFVPMSTLRRAVDEGRAETEFTVQAAPLRTDGATGLHLDCIHTGRMLFGTGLHHAMSIEHASVAQKATALFSTAPSTNTLHKARTLAGMKRAVLRTAENSRAADLLHLHCTSHYWSLSAGCTTSVECVVMAKVPGGAVVATSLPLVLQAAEEAVLYPDVVHIEQEGLAVGTSVWLALTWGGGDDSVVVDGITGVPAFSAREELLSFDGHEGKVVVFANPVDTMAATGSDVLRECATSELCNAMLAAEEHVAAFHCPLYFTKKGSRRRVPFARVSLNSGFIIFSGGGDVTDVRLGGSHRHAWIQLVALCRRVGVHVSPYCDEVVQHYPWSLPPADTNVQGTRRCSEKELQHLRAAHMSFYPGDPCVLDAWEVVDPAAEFAFNRLELELAAKGKGVERVDRVSAYSYMDNERRTNHVELSMRKMMGCTYSRGKVDSSFGLLVVYDTLLSQSVDHEQLCVYREEYRRDDGEMCTAEHTWRPAEHFMHRANFAVPKKRCLPRHILLVGTTAYPQAALDVSTYKASPYEIQHPFECTPLPMEHTPPQEPDVEENYQDLSELLRLLPQENVLVSADPVTHAPLRFALTQRLPSTWHAQLCTELTMTPEWHDLYNAYRFSASSACVEKELWGLHPYVHPMSATGDMQAEITFPGFDVPTLSWLLPPRVQAGEAEGYYFTSLARKAGAGKWDALTSEYTKQYGARAGDPLSPVCVLVRYRVAWKDTAQYERSFDPETNTYFVKTQAQFLPVGAVTCYNRPLKDTRLPMTNVARKNPSRYYNQRATFKCQAPQGNPKWKDRTVLMRMY